MREDEIAQFLSRFIENGDRILEVGCGDCGLLRKIIDTAKVRVFGIDPLVKGSDVEIPCWSLRAEEIDRLNKNFDLIYTVYSLHHFDDVGEFLKKARERLFDGGKLVIIDWRHGVDTGVRERYFKVGEIEKFLNKAGFHMFEKNFQEDTQIIVSGLRSAV